MSVKSFSKKEFRSSGLGSKLRGKSKRNHRNFVKEYYLKITDNPAYTDALMYEEDLFGNNEYQDIVEHTDYRKEKLWKDEEDDREKPYSPYYRTMLKITAALEERKQRGVTDVRYYYDQDVKTIGKRCKSRCGYSMDKHNDPCMVISCLKMRCPDSKYCNRHRCKIPSCTYRLNHHIHPCHAASCFDSRCPDSLFCAQHRCLAPSCVAMKSSCSHTCNSSYCPNPPRKNGGWCDSHGCLINTCPQPKKCSEHACSWSYCSVARKCDSIYCNTHGCSWKGPNGDSCPNERKCLEHSCVIQYCTALRKGEGFLFCKQHTCPADGCTHYVSHSGQGCTIHRCIMSCSSLKTKDSPYCRYHKCRWCQNLAEKCATHSCVSCRRRLYNNVTTKLCYLCTCARNNCIHKRLISNVCRLHAPRCALCDDLVVSPPHGDSGVETKLCSKHIKCPICKFRQRADGKATCGQHQQTTEIQPYTSDKEISFTSKTHEETLRMCRTLRYIGQTRPLKFMNDNHNLDKRKKNIVACWRLVGEQLPEDLYIELEDLMFWGDKPYPSIEN